MDREKEISKLYGVFKALDRLQYDGVHRNDTKANYAKAKWIIDNDYRKADDVRRETASDILKTIRHENISYGLYKEIAQKYGLEVE